MIIWKEHNDNRRIILESTEKFWWFDKYIEKIVYRVSVDEDGSEMTLSVFDTAGQDEYDS